MHLSEHIMTRNNCYRAGGTFTPKGIMIESAGVAQSDVAALLNSWNQPGAERCPHALVHREGVTETLPWNWRGWCGNLLPKVGLPASSGHITIALLEPAGHTWRGGEPAGYDTEKNAAYFVAVYQNTVELCSALCIRYGLDPMTALVDHAEGEALGIAPDGGDVAHWFSKHGKSIERLRADVRVFMAGGSGGCMTQEQFNDMFETAMTAFLKRQEERPVSPWAATAWNRASADGIFDGSKPCGNLTREQAALVLDRLKLIQ